MHASGNGRALRSVCLREATDVDAVCGCKFPPLSLFAQSQWVTGLKASNSAMDRRIGRQPACEAEMYVRKPKALAPLAQFR